MKLTFIRTDEFAAQRAAEAWCAQNSVSVGRCQGPAARGLLYGDFDIAKWRNLTPADIAALDGRMTGDMRHGPVYVDIIERADAEARALRAGFDAINAGATP